MSDFTTTLRQHSADLLTAVVVADRDAENVYMFTMRDIIKFLLRSKYRYAEPFNARTIFAERSHSWIRREYPRRRTETVMMLSSLCPFAIEGSRLEPRRTLTHSGNERAGGRHDNSGTIHW
jgi:hypothetical protein